jgi:hypothetical protein
VFRYPSLFLCLHGLGPLASSHSQLILNIINLTRSFRINFLLPYLFICLVPIYICSISYSPSPLPSSSLTFWSAQLSVQGVDWYGTSNYVQTVLSEIFEKKYIFSDFKLFYSMMNHGPPLWSSGQSSWLQMQGSLVRFPGTTKKSSWSGTGSTQPPEYNWGATW